MACYVLSTFCFLLLISSSFGTYLRTWKRASVYGCRSGDCSMIVSALRDPRTLMWRPERWNKAINHFNAYTDLFSDDNSASTYKRNMYLEDNIE